MQNKKAAVFILLGQSNAVGHGIPMREEDKILTPMPNVFGLSREKNQRLDLDRLTWEGYVSFGMNLAEQQDNTYSVANCLAAEWQAQIDAGKALPDLYILQIAIGAQGVTDGYMWHPDRAPQLIPGKLGKVDISLFPFTAHVLSLLEKSFAARGVEYEILGLHWRGGENDVSATDEHLHEHLEKIYCRIFDEFDRLLGKAPTVLHRLVCPDRMMDTDPTGGKLARMHYINEVFDKLAAERENFSLFDARNAPQFIPDVRGNGIFIADAVHFTPEVNAWVAGEILKDYENKQNQEKRR